MPDWLDVIWIPVRAYANSPWGWGVLVLGILIAAAGGGPLSRRLGCSRTVAMGLIISTAPIVMFTLPSPMIGVRADAIPKLGRFFGTFIEPYTYSDLPIQLGQPEGIANVLLFVPLGFFLMMATRRPVPSLLVGIGSSLLIEMWQEVSARGGSPGDVFINGAGGAIGVCVAWILWRLLRQRHATLATPAD
ncbi:hypothetical protein Afil01_31260 [Actinorhabdospora filicis]|uniref:VanZ-like domain-containing protein n=1 Tax=Actinorhabdospora filicis TaxID=1785913 RepID=A0A9W6W985_9ACTN|nr:VanZ family protein [Actinorhabdospora filicis]GLZ78319.1 hypothetical protein Afil01_31260 [Actinorhabdospora filicis]